MNILEKIPKYQAGRPPRPIFETTFLEELKVNWGENWGAQSAAGKLRKVLLHPPGEECKAPILAKDPAFFNLPMGLPDYEKMRKQHENLCDVMKGEGVDVVFLNPRGPLLGTYGLPLRSACYTHESVVIKGGAIIERPAMAYKKGYEVYQAKRLMEIGCPILYTVHGSGVFEGSNLWFLDEKTALVGVGLRTNMEAVEQITPILRRAGVDEIHVVYLPGYLERREYQVGGSSGIFHLDMTFGMADEGLGVIYPGGVDYNTIEYLEKKEINLIEVPEEELRNCAPNIFPLAPRKVLIPSGNPETTRSLRKEGVDVIEVDLSEFVKGGGGPRCLSLDLVRD
jgi:N-dimethylarginine dimethylaminohydrolase